MVRLYTYSHSPYLYTPAVSVSHLSCPISHYLEF
uniref:Uncharacterized protein n=1 Tax=Picea sitchensis TaxID=3332 RepID=A9NMW4_PICSI|nr:unknown [Picea sitchensis]